MEKLDEALLALEAEIFDGEFPTTENDEFLVRALSEWSPTERRSSFASLIKRYGSADIGTHIVHALARLICRDIELQLACIFRPVDYPFGGHY